MEERPKVVPVGDSLLIEGVAASLASWRTLAVIRLECNAVDIEECLRSHRPDVIIFELDSPPSPIVLSLLIKWSQILLIGLDLDSSRVIVLDSHPQVARTMNELYLVVQAEAGQKACLSKGGGLTECNGTTRG